MANKILRSNFSVSGNVSSDAFIVVGGTSSQFLKGDGTLDSNTYDNYASWNLKTNGVQRTTIGSGGNLDIVGGTNVTASYGAGGVVTLNATNTTYTEYTGTTAGLVPTGTNGTINYLREDGTWAEPPVASLGSGSTVTHTQSVSATIWSFSHNLGTRYPIIQVWDSNDQEIIPLRIEIIDVNNVEIEFSTSRTGVASAVAGGISVPGTTLSALTDTELSATTDGYVLTYDGITSKWVASVASTPTSALSALTDTTISSPTDGQALTWNDGVGTWSATTIVSNVGDVIKAGTPVNQQIGIWVGDGTLGADTGLNFNTADNRLEIGVNDSEFGAISLFGNSTTTGGVINVYNGNSGDTTDDYYYIKGGNGTFDFGGITTGNFLIYTSATQTLSVEKAITSNQTIVNINATGVTALTTKEYVDSLAVINTDDYINSASFNTSNGILTLSKLSGGTVTVNLDNRYSLTSHTHTLSALTDTELSATTDGYVLTYDGVTSKWVATSGTTNGSATIIDDSVPTVINGGTWYQPTEGAFSVGMDDIWVEVNRVGPRGPQGISGTTGVDATSNSGSGTTIIDLSQLGGFYYDMALANSATTYTTTGQTLGGFACVLINASVEPTITSATKIRGSTFIASTDMHMWVQFFGEVTQYYFLEL